MMRSPAMDSAPLDWSGSGRRAYELLLRQCFEAFADKVFHILSPGEVFKANWHIELICDRLEKVRGGKIRRLIINLPPRGLKSMLVSVAFPAFLLGHVDVALRVDGDAVRQRELSEIASGSSTQV